MFYLFINLITYKYINILIYLFVHMFMFMLIFLYKTNILIDFTFTGKVNVVIINKSK